MKGFYVLLGVGGLAGAGWLVYAARHKAVERPSATAPVAVAAADSFRGYTLGSDAAPVAITEYSDYQCPFCAAFATVQMPVVREQLIATGKLRWRFRDFPLSSHKYSIYAALAAECAGEQGKFWEMHDQLFSQHQWAQTGKDPKGVFRDFARNIGLDLDRYGACVGSQRYAGRIEASRQEGEALGVNSTPSLFVNGRKYEGRATSDALQTLVDSLSAAHRKR